MFTFSIANSWATNPKIRALCILVLASFVLLLCTHYFGNLEPSRSIRIAPENELKYALFECPDEKTRTGQLLDRFAVQIGSNESFATGQLIHWAHALEHYDPIRSRKLVEELVQPFTPHGRQRISRTRYGLRFMSDDLSRSDGEVHDYQGLATLANLKLPLDRQISIGNNSYYVRDLVQDCEANFDLRGEFEWSVIAIFAYFPGKRKITNHFGEEFTVSEIVDALINRMPGSGTCFGTHVIQALLTLEWAGINSKYATIDSDQNRITAYLDSLEKYICEELESVGIVSSNWGRRWIGSEAYQKWAHNHFRNGLNFQARKRKPTLKDSILVTSHHIEWLLMRSYAKNGNAISNLRVFDKSTVRLSDFLRKQLHDLELYRKGEGAGMRNGYCVCSHSFHVLSLISRD